MGGIGIGEFSQGIDTAGVEAYLSQIKSEALDKASEAVLNTSDLENACTQNWEGQACKDFIEKLRASAKHLSEQYEMLYENLSNQINKTASEMKRFDETLL